MSSPLLATPGAVPAVAGRPESVRRHRVRILGVRVLSVRILDIRSLGVPILDVSILGVWSLGIRVRRDGGGVRIVGYRHGVVVAAPVIRSGSRVTEAVPWRDGLVLRVVLGLLILGLLILRRLLFGWLVLRRLILRWLVLRWPGPGLPGGRRRISPITGSPWSRLWHAPTSSIRLRTQQVYPVNMNET